MGMVRWDMRVPPEELAEWKHAAAGDGKLLSEWIRELCNAECAGIQDLRKGSEVSVEERGTDKPLGPSVDIPAAVKVRKPAGTCGHGIGKGYRCWQCGGLAVIE